MIKDIPLPLKSLPYQYGGLNITTLHDLAEITYIKSRLQDCHILSEYEDFNIDHDSAKQNHDIREKYYRNKLIKDPRLRNRIYKTETYSKITITVQKPPINAKQFISDNEFSLMIDQIYGTDHTDTAWKNYNRCPIHKDKECNLDHMLCCARTANLQRVRCHNPVCYDNYKQLKKNKDIKDTKMEAYSDRQQELRNNNNNNKRADILFKHNDIQHSIDVAVISSRNSTTNGPNPLVRYYTVKLRAYSREANVHPIILKTDGDIHPESWKYLNSLGFNISHLREIQHIILKYTALKVQDAMDLNVRTWKQRDRNQQRRLNASKRIQQSDPQLTDKNTNTLTCKK